MQSPTKTSGTASPALLRVGLLTLCAFALPIGCDPGGGALTGGSGSGVSSGSSASSGSSGTATGSSGGTSSGSASGSGDASASSGDDGSAGVPGGRIYVSPSGNDANPGTASSPVHTLQKAQALVRASNAAMTSDISVILADGYYRLTSPLTLDASDSGTGGHDIVWTADSSARPVVVGSTQVTGWTQLPGSSGVWTAQGPTGIKTRQLYVDGARATRATGPAPSADALAGWVDPSGGSPSNVEFVYVGGFGQWTEGRCPVASISGGTINMAQPCWDNSTQRGNDLVGFAGIMEPPTRAENAYALLDTPGEWYLDEASSKFYYMPLAGQDLTHVDVEAPVLEALVTGGGTPAAPLHNVIFHRIQFSYATWLGPSGPNGFSEIQANYLVWGTAGPQAGNAEFSWYQIPANVSLTYAQNVQFTDDAFVHLGAAGLGLGDGVQNCLVQGNVVADTSGNAIELGNDDMRNATGADQTLGNTIKDNHVFDAPVEYHGGIGIAVGYAAGSSIVHNQVDHTPYTGISIGWGGWLDKEGIPGLANYAHDNDVSYNLLFNVMQILGDGAGIYANGQTSANQSLSTGETMKGNVVHDLSGNFYAFYTDNGSDWITMTGNVFWNPSGGTPFGSCHQNYYPGEGGGLDNEIIQGNYWQGSPVGNSDAHCQISGNTTISGPGDVPPAILAASGLEPAYQSLLQWAQVPPPPVQ
jgi:hypothetical protein